MKKGKQNGKAKGKVKDKPQRIGAEELEVILQNLEKRALQATALAQQTPQSERGGGSGDDTAEGKTARAEAMQALDFLVGAGHKAPGASALAARWCDSCDALAKVFKTWMVMMTSEAAAVGMLAVASWPEMPLEFWTVLLSLLATQEDYSNRLMKGGLVKILLTYQ